MKSYDYRIAAVGSKLLVAGLNLIGIKEAYEIEEPEAATSKIKELAGRSDIGMIIVNENLVKEIKDRKVRNMINESSMPIFVQVPDFKEEEEIGEELKELVMRAIGIDIKNIKG
ncbi:MAG: V-type ATP synthase subunit F [Candidatus Micrarchaeia archaeon]